MSVNALYPFFRVFLNGFVLIYSFLLFSCGGGKKLRASDVEDRDLYKAINVLNKNPRHHRAGSDLPVLYAQSKNRHLNNIQQFRLDPSPVRFDQIFREYKALQDIYFAINGNLDMKSLVKPTDFSSELMDSRMNAARYFYEEGKRLELLSGGRDRAVMRQGFDSYQRARDYIPDYLDAGVRMDSLLRAATLSVLVQNTRIDVFNFWNFGNPFNDQMERQLIQDLGGSTMNRNAALFFGENESRGGNVQPDVVVGLSWSMLLLNVSPTFQSEDRNVSRSVKQRNPTTGREENVTVTGVLKITRRIYSVSGNFNIDVKSVGDNRSLGFSSMPTQADYIFESATFTGDSRALSENDRIIVNRRFIPPTPFQLLNELFQRVRPSARNFIMQKTSW